MTADEYEHVRYTKESLIEDDPNFEEEYDWDRDDYVIVDQGDGIDSQEVEHNYGWGNEPDVLRARIIQRKSDGKYFKMTVHWDSWGSLDYNSTGNCGDIIEVIPQEVTRLVFVPA